MWFSFWPSLFIYINVSSEIVDKMTKGSSILCIEQIWTNSTESHPLSSRVFFYRIIYHTFFFQKEKKKEPRDVLLRMEGREGERDGAVLREPSGDVRGEVEKAQNLFSRSLGRAHETLSFSRLSSREQTRCVCGKEEVT